MSCISLVSPIKNSLAMQSNLSGSWNTCTLPGSKSFKVCATSLRQVLVQKVKHVFALSWTSQCSYREESMGQSACTSALSYYTSPSPAGWRICTASPRTRGYDNQIRWVKVYCRLGQHMQAINIWNYKARFQLHCIHTSKDFYLQIGMLQYLWIILS